MVFFSNDGMVMVFENSHHHHWWNGTCSAMHWQRWFFNGFSNFEDQWFTMVTGREPLIMHFSQKNEICDKMRVNKYDSYQFNSCMTKYHKILSDRTKFMTKMVIQNTKICNNFFIGNDPLPPLECFQKIIQISGDNDTVIWCNMAQESPWSVLPGKGTRRIFKGMHRCSQVQMHRCSHRKKEVWKINFLSTKVIKHRFSWIPF